MLGERQKTVISLQFVKIDGKEKKKTSYQTQPTGPVKAKVGTPYMVWLATPPPLLSLTTFTKN